MAKTQRKLPVDGLIIIRARCSRDAKGGYSSECSGTFFAIFYKHHDKIRKIGQHPSAADLAFGALDEAYDKELDHQRRRELGTAIGLHAHSVGIGAFVYLRRIFEGLIKDAHREATRVKDWDEDAYFQARVPQRISLLQNHLPSRLVTSAHLYGLLSKGIHELSEQECVDKFDLIKAAIELILKARHEDKRFQSVVKEVTSSDVVE